jgi:NitT/TauT family transport system substrate-binding protein
VALRSGTRSTGRRGRFAPMAGVTLALVAAVVAGCSGSDDDADTGAQNVDPNAVLDVTFQPATESFAVLTQLNAFAGGYFDKEKLNVTYNPIIPNAAQAAQSVTTNADIAIVGSTGVVSGIAARRDLVTVAVLTKGPTTQIVLRNDVVQRLGLTADSPIRDRFQALKGLTLALPQPGSTTDTATRQAMKLNGVEPDKDLTIRPITEPSALVTAMREGQVDGFAFSPPTSVQPVADGSAQVWVTLSDVAEFKELPWIDVVTSKDFLENNREAVTRFVRALDAAEKDLEANTATASTAIKAKYFPDLADDIYQLAFDLSLPTATQGLSPSPNGLQVAIDTINANADNQVDVTAEQVYDTSILDDLGTGS